MKEIILAAILASNIYPTAGKIVDADVLEDSVTFETASGMLYEFGGIEDWVVGDTVAAIMYDNETSYDVTDDIILSARYAGNDGNGKF